MNEDEELEKIKFLKEQIIMGLQKKLDDTSLLNSSVILLFELTGSKEELDDIEKMKSYGEDDEKQEFVFQETFIPPPFTSDSIKDDIRYHSTNKIPCFAIAVDKKETNYNKKMNNFALQFANQKVTKLDDAIFTLRIESYYNMDKTEYKVVDDKIEFVRDLDPGVKKIFLPYFN